MISQNIKCRLDFGFTLKKHRQRKIGDKNDLIKIQDSEMLLLGFVGIFILFWKIKEKRKKKKLFLYFSPR